jgi:ketosteroid isomerase-like protein
MRGRPPARARRPNRIQVDTVAAVSGTLRRFYALLDGADAERCLEMLAADLRFSILFSNGPGEARDFAGGRPEFDGYMAQRAAPTWTHHVLAESDHDGLEIVFGETRVDGAPLATFVAAVRLDDHGRIHRYIVGRSPAVLFEHGR